MACLTIERLSKDFPGPGGQSILALRELNLAVEEGELLVLVGPSASGKTTLLRLIAGLEEPTAGSVSLDGQRLDGVPPKDRDVAMVFQNGALYPHMTVAENLSFGLKLRGMPRAEVQRRVGAIAEMLGLANCLERLPAAISGGQRQRVALGRAMVRSPRLYLLDEPLSSLDLPMRLQMREELREYHRRLGSTMLYVTHDQAEAMALGDRVAVLCEGCLQQVAKPLTLYHEPANLFVAGFFGLPPMNFFHGSIVARAGAPVFEERTLPGEKVENVFSIPLTEEQAKPLAPCVDKPVVLGLRPAEITRAVSASGASSAGIVNARVELVEALGAETFVHLRKGVRRFRARLEAADRVVAGEDLRLAFNVARAHFFDPSTGEALR